MKAAFEGVTGTSRTGVPGDDAVDEEEEMVHAGLGGDLEAGIVCLRRGAQPKLKQFESDLKAYHALPKTMMHTRCGRGETVKPG